MKILKDLEKLLNDLFKGLPPLPESVKKWLADNAWIFAIIGIVLSVIAGLFLLTSAIFVSTAVNSNYVESLYVDQATNVNRFIFAAWLALAALSVNIFILLKAYPKLKVKARAGWDLMFLSMVLWLVFYALNWIRYSQGVGSIVLDILVSFVGFYILFQIRDKFGSKSTSPIK